MLSLKLKYLNILIFILVSELVSAIQPYGRNSFNFDPRKAGTGKIKSSYPTWGVGRNAKNNRNSSVANVHFKNINKDLNPSSNSQLDITALYGVFDNPNNKIPLKVNGKVSHKYNLPKEDSLPHIQHGFNTHQQNTRGPSSEKSTYTNFDTNYDYNYDYHDYHSGNNDGGGNKGGGHNNDAPFHSANVDFKTPQYSYVTITETRHLTSYITTSVYSTSYKYLTQISTQFVPTHVPTYVTNYVTSVATAYVTQKYPVYKTKFVTEYHTELHTLTDTQIQYKTQTEYQPSYITKTEKLKFTKTEFEYVTDFITKTEYVTSTFYFTSTEAFHSTSTSYLEVPYPLTTTIYDTVYVTKTFAKPYKFVSTVWQPQYITVTVTEPVKQYALPVNNYYPEKVQQPQQQYRTEAPSKTLNMTAPSTV